MKKIRILDRLTMPLLHRFLSRMGATGYTADYLVHLSSKAKLAIIDLYLPGCMLLFSGHAILWSPSLTGCNIPNLIRPLDLQLDYPNNLNEVKHRIMLVRGICPFLRSVGCLPEGRISHGNSNQEEAGQKAQEGAYCGQRSS